MPHSLLITEESDEDDSVNIVFLLDDEEEPPEKKIIYMDPSILVSEFRMIYLNSIYRKEYQLHQMKAQFRRSDRGCRKRFKKTGAGRPYR